MPGLIRREEGDRGGNILWLADSTERNPLGELGEEAGFITPLLLAKTQVRLDDAGTDGIGSDSIRSDLLSRE